MDDYKEKWGNELCPQTEAVIDDAFRDENLDFLIALLSDLQELQLEVEESINPLRGKIDV